MVKAVAVLSSMSMSMGLLRTREELIVTGATKFELALMVKLSLASVPMVAAFPTDKLSALANPATPKEENVPLPPTWRPPELI